MNNALLTQLTLPVSFRMGSDIASGGSSPELNFARVNIQCIAVNHLAG